MGNLDHYCKQYKIILKLFFHNIFLKRLYIVNLISLAMLTVLSAIQVSKLELFFFYMDVHVRFVMSAYDFPIAKLRIVL